MTGEIARVKKMLKSDNWVEKMTSPELLILAKINPDICEAHEETEHGRTRTIVKREFLNRYVLYAALRKKHRCPKNKHAEEILKQTKEK